MSDPRRIYRSLSMGLFLCLMPRPLGAQGLVYQFNLGWGEATSSWDTPKRHPHEFREWFPILLNAEIGMTYKLGPERRARVLLSSITGNFSNQQVAADYQWVLRHRGDREFYALAGPSLNTISGTYTFHSGYEPPDGQGDYRYVDQRWRPGAKVGVGFQWSRHWAVELDVHLIRMATSGFQSVPDANTGYATMMVSFRLPTN